MFFQLFVAATMRALGAMLFSRFELYTSAWRKITKLIMFPGGTALTAQFAGTGWAWLWIFGMFSVGVGFHTWWAHPHGSGV